jgi:hypothetical protein
MRKYRLSCGGDFDSSYAAEQKLHEHCERIGKDAQGRTFSITPIDDDGFPVEDASITHFRVIEAFPGGITTHQYFTEVPRARFFRGCAEYFPEERRLSRMRERLAQDNLEAERKFWASQPVAVRQEREDSQLRIQLQDMQKARGRHVCRNARCEHYWDTPYWQQLEKTMTEGPVLTECVD